MTTEIKLGVVLGVLVLVVSGLKLFQQWRAAKRRAERARKSTRPSIRPPIYFSALLLGLLVGIGCVPAQALVLLEKRKAVNEGHSKDPKLGPDAQAIALDAYDADCVLLELLDGQDLPGPVAERIAAREAARKAAGK